VTKLNQDLTSKDSILRFEHSWGDTNVLAIRTRDKQDFETFTLFDYNGLKPLDSPPYKLPKDVKNTGWVTWDRRYLLVLKNYEFMKESWTQLCVISTKTGEIKRTDLKSRGVLGGVRPHRDGKQLIYRISISGSSELWAMENLLPPGVAK